MDPVVHFEMPYDDDGRMAKFYRSAFGWRTKALGKKMGGYVLATTVETGLKGPKRPGAINGGFYERKPDWPAQYPSLVIAVDDIGKSIAKVEKAGGQVLGHPVDIPGVGSYVSFLDSEGNRVSMLQPIPMNWHAPAKKVKMKAGAKKAMKLKAGKKKKAGKRTNPRTQSLA